MVSPLSLTCLSVAGAPVSTTCEISPAWRWMVARSAPTSSVPWVIITLPVSTASPSSPISASVRSASTSIGWLRSVVLACASKGNTTARSIRLRATRRIASFDIGEQADPVGFHVGAQADPLKYRVRPGNGHGILAQGEVLLGENLQVRGGEAGAFAARRWRPGEVHVVVQAHFHALLGDPGSVGGRQPASLLAVGKGEARRPDAQALAAGIALQVWRHHREGFLAVGVERSQFEILQDVVRARGHRRQRAWLRLQLPDRDAGQDGGGGEQRRKQQRPLHGAPYRCNSESRCPCCSRMRSHSSRTAPSPPRAVVVQCTWPYSQSWRLAGATASPTCANRLRSARSSPI